MKTLTRRAVVACALTLVMPMILPTPAATFAQAAPEANVAPVTPLKIERVALFKNGLGYFTSSAKLPEKATTVVFGQIPLPSHGTFWVGYELGTPVKGLFTRLEETSKDTAVSNVGDLIAANVGKEVTLELPRGTESPAVIKGKILRVTETSQPEQPSPYVMSPRGIANNPYWQYPATMVVMIQTKEGVVALNSGLIQRCTIAGGDVATTRAIKRPTPTMRMELAQPAPGRPITVSYLAKGITWAPSYLIDLSDPKTARFTAKAEIINEVADLDAVNIELITGFPNLAFGDVPSPIGLNQNLEQFMQALARGRTEQRANRGYMMQQAVMMNQMDAGWDNEIAPAYSAAEAGREAEDLFLYPVRGVTLMRGETALLPLFSAEMPYEHVYTWAIPDAVDQNSNTYSYSRPAEGQRPAQEEVWHSARLTNNAKLPLTTAAAQFVKDGQIVGQDICYYTNPGSSTTIRINRAMRVLADQAENEAARARSVLQFQGYNYDKVTLKGELKLLSRLDKPTKIEVTKELSGELTNASDEPAVTKTGKGLRAVNPRLKLVWKVDIEPGKEKVIRYEYNVLVRQ